jgi:hypothetical protein
MFELYSIHSLTANSSVTGGRQLKKIAILIHSAVSHICDLWIHYGVN